MKKSMLDFLKNDLKQIIREPLMLMLLILPVIEILLFFVIKTMFWERLDQVLDVNLMQYEGYIGVMAIMTQTLLIGCVIGFLMLDEKDAKILQLLVVTPMGFLGYLVRRSVLPLVSNVIFVIFAFKLLSIQLSIPVYFVVLFFCVLESLTIGFFVMAFAEDKIKGLTLVKGMGILLVFGFAEIIPVKIIQWLGMLVPYYWNAQVILHGETWMMGIGMLVHLVFLALVVRKLKIMIL